MHFFHLMHMQSWFCCCFLYTTQITLWLEIMRCLSFGPREKWMNELWTMYTKNDEIILILIQRFQTKPFQLCCCIHENTSVFALYQLPTNSNQCNIQQVLTYVEYANEIKNHIILSFLLFLTKFNRCFATNSPWPILYVQNENVIDSVLSKIIDSEYRRWIILQ